MSEPIYADSLPVGDVDIFGVFDETPPDDAGPFLPEEQLLLKHIARWITIAVESHKTGERLRRSEARFCGITENSLSGIYIVKNGRLSYANRALADIFRYDKDELIGEDSMLLIYPDDRDVASRRLLDENLKRDVRYVCKGIRKDRTVIYLEINGSSYLQDGQATLFGSVADVTPRRELELRNKI